MVGQGVLGECLLDPEVTRVLTVGRTAPPNRHSKLTNLVHADIWHYDASKAAARTLPKLTRR